MPSTYLVLGRTRSAPFAEAPARLRKLELPCVGLLLVLLAIGLQLRAGAYGAELLYDESSHFISGLMIRDWLLSGELRAPMRFLSQFQSHYPLIGIGHWAPLYYVLEAVWLTLLPAGRASALVLSALVAAAISAVTYQVVRRRSGALAGIGAAAAVLASPVIQDGSSDVMLDLPVALLCLAAALAYARFLDTGRPRFSVLFGLLAGAALMVKGNAAALALLPPFALLIGRRFDLLRRPAFWAPVPIVAIIAGPWYVMTYGMVQAGFRYSWGLAYVRLATRANAAIMYAALGPLLIAAGLIGLAAVLAAPRRRPREDNPVIADAMGNDLVSVAALLIAVWVFQSLAPAAIQSRYLAPAVAPLVILAAWAAHLGCVQFEQSRLQPGSVALRGLVVAFVALSVLPFALGFSPKPRLGIVEAIPHIWTSRIENNPSVLLAVDGEAEVASIAELAMTDPHRPSLFAVRGSRLLGGGGYNTEDYVPRFRTAAEIMAQIDAYAIPLVLIHTGGTSQDWSHIRTVEEAARIFPDRWQLIYRDSRPPYQTMLYRIRGNDTKAADVAKLTELSGPRALRRR